MFPRQINIANSRKTISIPASFVPKGGFMTTRSTIRWGLSFLHFNWRISALIRSKSAPSTFSSSMVLVFSIQSESNSHPMTKLEQSRMVLGIQEDTPAHEHTSSHTNVGHCVLFDRFGLVDMEEQFGSNIRRSHMLLQIHLLFLSKLEIIDILEKILDVLLLEFPPSFHCWRLFIISFLSNSNNFDHIAHHSNWSAPQKWYASEQQDIMALKLASGSYDGTIKFWDPSTGSNVPSEEIKLAKFNLIPNRIEVSDNKQRLIVGMYNTCRIYDLTRSDTVERSLDVDFKGNVTAVGFRKHDQIIYTGCEDGFLRIFDLRKKSQIRTLKQNRPINCAVMHPNDVEILSGDQGGFFRLWDITNQKQRISILSDNEVGIRSISVSQNGQNIAFADNRGFIQPFYMEKGEHLSKCKSIQAHDDYILKIEISPNGKFLSTCSADKKIKLFKIVDPHKFEISQYKQLKGHLKWVWDCRFSCDSAYLISCSTDATLKLWGVEKGQLIKTLKGHEKGVICLALNDIADL